ncbi:tetratricopeptide repeat protein [Sphingomonas sp. ID1715]|uniref:tetratricopeptide repeat protein n=1 Tax=Sphingomonas sp. ID1715 TaxID=1656898 RepID=UPI0014888D92|nr:tetratricopeptide repeat protein [Sphingomonas sp. ID1715]NNM77482.1 tetratricopeptide repeat protein [Sphingomonas sp. ID1715]
MLLFLLAQAAQPSCTDQIAADPVKAAETANGWHERGGGALARQCAALAYVAQERWAEAATAFEQAARETRPEEQLASANLWVQAGNARLAGADPHAAVTAFDRALVAGQLSGPAKGEIRLDRARANVAAGDTAAARADLEEALRLVPEDPLAWLLSASLARRMDQLDRAQADIAEAAKRSPDDASVALEAGRIALAAGSLPAARLAFAAAIKNQPGSEAAKAAQAELDRLGAGAAAPGR